MAYKPAPKGASLFAETDYFALRNAVVKNQHAAAEKAADKLLMTVDGRRYAETKYEGWIWFELATVWEGEDSAKAKLYWQKTYDTSDSTKGCWRVAAARLGLAIALLLMLMACAGCGTTGSRALGDGQPHPAGVAGGAAGLGTAGMVVGGAAGMAIAGPPGAVGGAAVGGVAGAIVGGVLGREAADYVDPDVASEWQRGLPPPPGSASSRALGDGEVGGTDGSMDVSVRAPEGVVWSFQAGHSAPAPVMSTDVK